MKCNAHLNNTFYSYFRVHGKTQPRVFFDVRNGGVDAERGVLHENKIMRMTPSPPSSRGTFSVRFLLSVMLCVTEAQAVEIVS